MLLALLALVWIVKAQDVIRIPKTGEYSEDPGLVIEVEPPPIDPSEHMQMLDQAVTRGSLNKYGLFTIYSHKTTAWLNSLTLSVGDTVVRGPHWKWGEADGGNGRKGLVLSEVLIRK